MDFAWAHKVPCANCEWAPSHVSVTIKGEGHKHCLEGEVLGLAPALEMLEGELDMVHELGQIEFVVAAGG